MLTRRTFLGIAATLPFARVESRALGHEMRFDVAVIGGGLGGVAAALAAARAGKTVLLSEETDWIGGQLTQQAVPPDEHPWVESFGVTRSYRSLRDGIRRYYRDHYPLTLEARAAPHLNPGNGVVSHLCCEPRAVLAVLEAMLAPHVSTGRVLILRDHIPVNAKTAGNRIDVVTLKSARDGHERVIHAAYFIDATELGDLLALANVEHVTGAESQADTGEPHAPGTARPGNQQAFTCCFAIEHRPGEDHTIDRPKEYDFWREYVPDMKPSWPGKLLSWSMTDPVTLKPRKVYFDPTLKEKGPGLNLWLYRRIADRANFVAGAYPSDVCLINWPMNDYWLGNLIGGDADKHRQRGKELSLSLLYWMQTECGFPGLRLRPDIVGTADGLAKHPYVRESRRIKAEFTVLEQHVATASRPKGDVVAERFPDSVGVGSYRIDLHPSSGGDNYIDVSSLPFQIPLGSLIPVRVDNLLPACKNLGVTHITNGCYRLHPVEWNIGEAAGALAAFALEKKEPPRHIRKKHLAAFQQRLRNDGVELDWPRLSAR